MSTQETRVRLELLQGALVLSILRTAIFGPPRDFAATHFAC
jgi:hypothetical protein